MIHPGYLAGKQDLTIAPELPVAAEKTPPTFRAMTGDDLVRMENALFQPFQGRFWTVNAPTRLG